MWSRRDIIVFATDDRDDHFTPGRSPAMIDPRFHYLVECRWRKHHWYSRRYIHYVCSCGVERDNGLAMSWHLQICNEAHGFLP